jgi:hypothetical protein
MLVTGCIMTMFLLTPPSPYNDTWKNNMPPPQYSPDVAPSHPRPRLKVKLKVMSFNFILEIQQKSKEEE